MSNNLLLSIYDTMVSLGYDQKWALAWTSLWKVYFIDEEQTLVIDVLKS